MIAEAKNKELKEAPLKSQMEVLQKSQENLEKDGISEFERSEVTYVADNLMALDDEKTEKEYNDYAFMFKFSIGIKFFVSWKLVR